MALLIGNRYGLAGATTCISHTIVNNYHKIGSKKFIFDTDGYVIVYADGCCLDNGKPYAKSGIGVYFGPQHTFNVSERAIINAECRATNQNAEIQACTRAINILINEGYSRARIYTDSGFTISCAKEWMKGWKKKGWRRQGNKPVENKWSLIRLDDAISHMKHVDWKHVPSHQNQEQVQSDKHAEGNKKADELANAGARQLIIPIHE